MIEMSATHEREWRNDPKKQRRGTYLAVVAGKVEVVKGVVSWAVDDLFEKVAGDHVRVVDLEGERNQKSAEALRTRPEAGRSEEGRRGTHEDTPSVDKGEETDVELLVKGEDHGEEVVGEGLGVAVDGVEGVRGKRGWDYKRYRKDWYEGEGRRLSRGGSGHNSGRKGRGEGSSVLVSCGLG
jgi:hypothetical protein